MPLILACRVVETNNETITAKYLNGVKKIPIPEKCRPIKPEKLISVFGAEANNLKKLNVNFPLGIFTVVTGVSGSGKSSLVVDILQKILEKETRTEPAHNPSIPSKKFKEFVNPEIDKKVNKIPNNPKFNFPVKL